MAIISVTTLAELNTALASGAASGDTIECASGTYGNSSGGPFAPTRTLATKITVKPASGATVLFRSSATTNAALEIRASKLRFENIDIQQTVTINGYVVELVGASDVEFHQCNIHGIARDPNGNYSTAGSYTNALRGIGTTDAGVGVNRLIVTACNVYDVTEGIVVFSSGTGGITCYDTNIYNTYSDTAKLVIWGSAMGAAVPKDFQRNFFHSTIGYPTDGGGGPSYPLAPHVDGLQFVSNADNHNQNIEGVIFKQNTCIENTNTRGRGVQGLVSFLDGGFQCIIKDIIVEDNIFAITSNNSVSLSKIIGGTFRRNSCIFPGPIWDQPVGASQSEFRIGEVSSSGTVLVENNIFDVMTLGGGATYTNTGNIITGDQGATIPYSTVFNGPFYPNTFTEVKTAWTTKVAYAGKGPDVSKFGTIGLPNTWNLTGTTRNASTQAELNTAFGLSIPGDIINITGWSGTMTWTSRTYASDIFIVGNGFTSTGLAVSNCSHIYISDFNFIAGTTNANAVNDVLFPDGTTSSYITFDDCFMGASNFASVTAYAGWFNTAGESHCVFIPSTGSCTNLTIRGCRLKGRKYAGTFYAAGGLLIENCDIDYISSDGLKIVGVTGGTIRNNLFPRRHFPWPGDGVPNVEPKDHADAIVQFTSNCSGFTIHGNVFLPLIDDYFGFSGVIFGSNGNMSNMTVYQNLIAGPGDAGISMSDISGANYYNNTAMCYIPSTEAVSRIQIQIFGSGGSKLRNFEGTFRSDLSTTDMLTNNPAGPAGTRINSVYQTRYGASTDFHLYKMEPIDFTAVPGSSADFATNGSNTRGAYDTITKMLNGTWPGPAWDGPTPIGGGGGGGGGPVNKTLGGKVLRSSRRAFRLRML